MRIFGHFCNSFLFIIYIYNHAMYNNLESCDDYNYNFSEVDINQGNGKINVILQSQLLGITLKMLNNVTFSPDKHAIALGDD